MDQATNLHSCLQRPSRNMVPSKWRVACPNFSLVNTRRSARPELLSFLKDLLLLGLSFISTGVSTYIEVPPVFISCQILLLVFDPVVKGHRCGTGVTIGVGLNTSLQVPINESTIEETLTAGDGWPHKVRSWGDNWWGFEVRLTEVWNVVNIRLG